jgi:[acyl-carrier-protein] S-malonyltransferase
LNVSGAFHSPLMTVAETGLAEQLDGVAMMAPTFPVVSNVDASPVLEVGSARRLLVQQLTSPVRWTSCMQTMLGAGVARFIEVGPGSVLAGLLKRIDRAAESLTLGTAEEIETFLNQ